MKRSALLNYSNCDKNFRLKKNGDVSSQNASRPYFSPSTIKSVFRSRITDSQGPLVTTDKDISPNLLSSKVTENMYGNDLMEGP